MKKTPFFPPSHAVTIEKKINWSQTLSNLLQHFTKCIDEPDPAKERMHEGVYTTAVTLYYHFMKLCGQRKSPVISYSHFTTNRGLAALARRDECTIRRRISRMLQHGFLVSKKRTDHGIQVTMNFALVAWTETTKSVVDFASGGAKPAGLSAPDAQTTANFSQRVKAAHKPGNSRIKEDLSLSDLLKSQMGLDFSGGAAPAT